MKKILSVIALALAIAVSFTSCDNRPPYMRLAAAIDSLNNQYQESHPDVKEPLITYEKWENQVHFNVDFPGVIEEEAFEPIANNIRERFLLQLVTDDEFYIATEIIDAKSNIVLDIHGLEDTKYEVLIVTNEIIDAFNAVHPAEGTEPEIEEPVDTLSQGEIEHELLEGNIQSVEEGVEKLEDAN